LTKGLVAALHESGVLDLPFPFTGQVVSSPDPANPNGSLLGCAQPFAPVPGALPCIGLDAGGDFIQLQAVTWQTEVAFMYVFYFQPSDRAQVDPTRDFVALNVFVAHDPSIYAGVDAAVQSAAEEAGAVPYRPPQGD
jgi:hypothetical protein